MSDSMNSIELAIDPKKPIAFVDTQSKYGGYSVVVGFDIRSHQSIDKYGQSFAIDLPESVLDVLTIDRLKAFTLFHHLMYKFSEYRQPVLRFTTVSKYGQKILLESSFSNGRVASDILTFTTRYYDEKQSAEVSFKSSEVIIRTTSPEDVLINHVTWFDKPFCKVRLSKNGGHTFIQLDELDGLASFFNTHIKREFDLTINKGCFSVESNQF